MVHASFHIIHIHSWMFLDCLASGFLIIKFYKEKRKKWFNALIKINSIQTEPKRMSYSALIIYIKIFVLVIYLG